MCVVFYITLFPPKNNFYIIILLFYFVFTKMHVMGTHAFLALFAIKQISRKTTMLSCTCACTFYL
jgi:hypothetical protein